MFFGLQETRDSLKRAFENLFEKYDQEFDDDDEIDILSLKVVKKSNKKSAEGQKTRKFGFLYRKEGTKDLKHFFIFNSLKVNNYQRRMLVTVTMEMKKMKTLMELQHLLI